MKKQFFLLVSLTPFFITEILFSKVQSIELEQKKIKMLNNKLNELQNKNLIIKKIKQQIDELKEKRNEINNQILKAAGINTLRDTITDMQIKIQSAKSTTSKSEVAQLNKALNDKLMTLQEKEQAIAAELKEKVFPLDKKIRALIVELRTTEMAIPEIASIYEQINTEQKNTFRSFKK